MTRVLGVDPGIARTGLAVVEGRPGALRLLHAECVETSPDTPAPLRLAALLAGVEGACARWQPDAAAVEEVFFATNRRSAIAVGEGRGVALCALGRAGIAVFGYTPLQVKEAVAGYGAAGKPQVGAMTRRLLGVESIPGPDDVADACAIAVCHHHRAAMLHVAPRGGTRRAPTPALAAAIARARRAAP